MRLKIASFNTWNNFKGNVKKRSVVLSNIIKRENVDVIGLQEVTYNYANSLMDNLVNYKMYGEYRFLKFLKRMSFNENNGILTNREVEYTKTYKLPFFPNNFRDLNSSTNLKRWSLLPRVATVVLIKSDDKKTCIINTHLDYKIKSVKLLQLDYLKRLIEKYSNYPMILMGDFNMELNTKEFNLFVRDLSMLGINRVRLDNSTWGRSKRKRTIDHFFISNEISLLNSKVLTSDEIVKISDHNMLIMEVEIN